MRHSTGHIMEVSWSFAAEWIEGIHMFAYRLIDDLHDGGKVVNRLNRQDVDFQCFLIACRRLERAVAMAEAEWPDSKEKLALNTALKKYRSSTPFLAPLRNAGEHFDDYLMQRGRDKSIDSRGLRVYEVDQETNKTYRMKWLEFDVDVIEASQAADELYHVFVSAYRDSGNSNSN